MKKAATIVRRSLSEVNEIRRRGEDPLNPNAPASEFLGVDFWKNAKVVMPHERGKTSVHLRLDSDVVDWFRHHGKGHLTRMNAVLRAYVEAQKQSV
jgi:uncharacterized protein (DUF4415 family)